MRIAIVAYYKNVIGGAESVNWSLKKLFESRGHEVTLITTEDAQGLRLNPLLKNLIGKPFLTAAVYRKRKDRFDAVICSGEFGYGIKHPVCAVLFHMSYPAYRDALKGHLSPREYLGLTKGRFIQNLASKGKTVIAVSEFLKNNLVSQGIRVDGVISNSVDTDFFAPDPSAKKNGRCLFVGRYEYFPKGFDILEKLADMGVPIDCLTTEKPSVSARNMEWIGTAERSRMPAVYNSHNILLVPSRYESFSLTAIEAMACGIPVVMAEVGIGFELKKEVPEFVVGGWNSASVDEYYRKIAEINRNYPEYSRKARDFCIRHYSYGIFENKWLSLLDDLKRKSAANA